MTTYDDLPSRYIDTWNETDPSARRAAWISSTRGRPLHRPVGVAEGPEAIASMIVAVQQQFPDFRCRLAGPVDGHHDQARSAGSWARRDHQHRSWDST